MASSSSSYNSPCAACKLLRRKCVAGCIYAPYFPPEEPQKFVNVHRIFGASNVSKLLNDIVPHQREDAVNSLVYEAEARVRDPVYGCVGAITFLQRQVHRLQKELDAVNADLILYAAFNEIPTSAAALLQQQQPAAGPPAVSSIHSVVPRQRPLIEYSRRNIDNEGEGFYQQPPAYYSHPHHSYNLPYWNDNPSGDINQGGEEGNM